MHDTQSFNELKMKPSEEGSPQQRALEQLKGRTVVCASDDARMALERCLRANQIELREVKIDVKEPNLAYELFINNPSPTGAGGHFFVGG